jgi:uncharacterized protein with HEPN domain
VPPRDWRLRIDDILDAIKKVEVYTRGMTLESFAGDSRTVDAVVRNLEVIGEASRHLDDMIVRAAPEVPWDQMRAMRNVVAHQYFGVDVAIIWQTAKQDIPPLEAPLRRLLEARS